MSSPTVASARIRRFLEEEPVVWLSTVRPDGAPHIVPIWFWWDGGALVVASKPGAQKVRNLRANPSVMLALGDAEDDFDVGLVKGRAELLDRPARRGPAGRPVRQVRDAADRDRASMRPSSPRPIRRSSGSSRTTYLGWHGRSTPQSVRVAGAPAISIDEPRRVAGRGAGHPPPRPAPAAHRRTGTPPGVAAGPVSRTPLLPRVRRGPALTV